MNYEKKKKWIDFASPFALCATLRSFLCYRCCPLFLSIVSLPFLSFVPQTSTNARTIYFMNKFYSFIILFLRNSTENSWKNNIFSWINRKFISFYFHSVPWKFHTIPIRWRPLTSPSNLLFHWSPITQHNEMIGRTLRLLANDSSVCSNNPKLARHDDKRFLISLSNNFKNFCFSLEIPANHLLRPVRSSNHLQTLYL